MASMNQGGSGIFKQEWLCSTVREIPDPCGTEDGKNASIADQANSERVSIEGIDLYGLKLAYYVVDENVVRDPLFGEDQLDEIDRAFWFMGYVTQLPPNVRTYQLQGIWGEDIVQLYVATAAFKYFSTYGGSDRNTPEVYTDLGPRIGDIVYIPNNHHFYEIVDVKLWEEAFGLTSKYTLMTLRMYKDNKKSVRENPTIPYDDPIRKVAPAVGLDETEPSVDVLRPDPKSNKMVDPDKVDMFDWLYDFNKEN